MSFHHTPPIAQRVEMPRRRAGVLALCVCALLRPMGVIAQAAPKVWRVGVLAPSTRAAEEVVLKPFFEGMQELGWIEGRNVVYERSYADNDYTRLPGLANALVARKVDLIYAPPTVSAQAAQKATRTIPIVFGSGSEPVAMGLVQSLAHPGGNVTGISTLSSELSAKRLQLLKELLPEMRRVGILFNPDELRWPIERVALEDACRLLGLAAVFAQAAHPAQFESAMQNLVRAGVGGVLLGATTLFNNQRAALIGIAQRLKLAMFTALGQSVRDGALASYGANVGAQLHRSAYIVDKILKGANAADIPVELPTKFDMVVNKKTAKALGITIPYSVMLRATEVIE